MIVNVTCPKGHEFFSNFSPFSYYCSKCDPNKIFMGLGTWNSSQCKVTGVDK